MKALDLSSLVNSDKGSVLEVRHPVTGEVLRAEDGSPVTITLLGIDSEESLKAQREAQRRRLRKGHSHRTTPEELEAEALTLLAALTVSWQGVGLKGEELECTEANVKRVYTELRWLRKQVDTFVTEIEHFLGN